MYHNRLLLRYIYGKQNCPALQERGQFVAIFFLPCKKIWLAS